MYLITAEMLDVLTANAPSPSCQANFIPCSLIHFEEFDLTRVTALASVRVGGRRKRMWMWSSMPPTANARMSWFLQIAAVYDHRRGCSFLGMIFWRFCVLEPRGTGL